MPVAAREALQHSSQRRACVRLTNENEEFDGSDVRILVQATGELGRMRDSKNHLPLYFR